MKSPNNPQYVAVGIAGIIPKDARQVDGVRTYATRIFLDC
jgi:hypothetical protein